MIGYNNNDVGNLTKEQLCSSQVDKGKSSWHLVVLGQCGAVLGGYGVALGHCRAAMVDT